MILDYFIYLLISFVFFAIGGNLIVKSLIKVEKYYHLREFVVGFLLIGISTSVPELSVGIISSLNNISSLSFGNIIGANFVVLTLVMGVVTLISKSVKFEAQLEKGTIFIIAAMTILPLILFLDQELSRIDGFILIIAFFLYIARLLIIRKKFKEAKDGTVSKREVHKDILLFIIGLSILIIFARIIVYLASQIASELAFPPIVIGLIIVSMGTTLPEIFFETKSVLKGHSSLALGDLLGSLAFNSTLVLGIASLLSPIQAPFSSFVKGSMFFLVSLLTFLVFARTGNEITRKEGIVLLILYILFVTSNILFR